MKPKITLKKAFSFSWRDLGISLFMLVAVSVLAYLLRLLDGNDWYVPMLFIFAVFLISRYTNGYLFGVLGSIACVFLVNFVFTYPYFAFNFTISGYPLTFISMFGVSMITCTMTTQIKQQERLQLEAEKEKMRGNLLRAVSHDLRTPLTSIMGTTSALLENGDRLTAQQKRQLLKESHDDAEWLIRMVENLLSITRINGGETKIKKNTEAAEEIISEALSKFQKRFPEAEVDVSVPEELLLVPMDAILIEQVLMNLLENSVLHGKKNTGIYLSLSEESGNAVFLVCDQGEGIPENVLPRLFDGYISTTEQGESDSKRNMGIGLSVCMSIVRAHGGTMWARNRSQGGTEVGFSLPMEENS